jgi:hypothetical protein
MAITMVEKCISRRWDVEKTRNILEKQYLLTGSADDEDILAHVLANCTPVTNRESIHIEPEWADTEKNDGLWHATVQWLEEAETEEWVTSIQTTGGVDHITQSITTLGMYLPDGATGAPDNEYTIGAYQDHVDGADIIVPRYDVQETEYYTDAQVTPAYRYTLFSLTGKVNNAAWPPDLAIWEAGEVLFNGANLVRRAEEKWEVTFNFSWSKNRTNIAIGNGIVVAAKKGWDLLWVRYEPQQIYQGRQRLVPVAAYVEQVYEYADLSAVYPA